MIIPLTCVVDYHGFRVLAVAKVPISTSIFTSSGKLRRVREDMVHGTPDGGGTILNENRILNSKLQEVAERLNLSSHMVKVKRHRQGNDSQFITEDCAGSSYESHERHDVKRKPFSLFCLEGRRKPDPMYTAQAGSCANDPEARPDCLGGVMWGSDPLEALSTRRCARAALL